MLQYKILIAVVGESEAFEKCISKCPDKSKLVIVDNWNNPDVARLCNSYAKEGAEVRWFPHNLGCAGAMNVGLRKIKEDNLDYVIILSPSALFTNSVQDFVDIIEKREETEKNYYYLTVAEENLVEKGCKTDLHAFAVTRKCVREIGLYDENFYPVYYDDTDYGYRMGLAGATKTIVYPPRISQNLGGGVKSDRAIFDLYFQNAPHIHDYYQRKWGGEQGSEKYTHPFNDPTKSIRFWNLEKDRIIRIP